MNPTVLAQASTLRERLVAWPAPLTHPPGHIVLIMKCDAQARPLLLSFRLNKAVSVPMSRRKDILSQAVKALHIGANKGQEAKLYAQCGIRAWHVEAIPDVYESLRDSLKGLVGQTPLLKCLSSKPGQRISFQVANNGGESSSILPLGNHKNCYPMVAYTHSIEVITSTVDQLIRDGEVDADLDLLVIDAQGAELMILEGSRDLLASGVVKYAFVEVSVEPLYEGGVSYLEVAEFLRGYGLHLRELIFNEKGWTDAVFEQVFWPTSLPYSEGAEGTNIAPMAAIELSSAIILPPLQSFTGERTGRFSFHTALEEGPWVKMTFPRLIKAASVVVFNRCDDCSERAYPLNIYASQDGIDWDLVLENHDPFGGVDWPGPLRLRVGQEFRALMFSLRGEDYLHFDQVEVYAEPLP